MKKVVSSSEVFHKWAHQTQPCAYNSARTISFDGAIAFSYHTEIGAIFQRRKGVHANQIVLICSGRFSNTTAKHMHRMRTAVSHLKSITVPHVRPRWGSNNSNLESAHHDLNLKYLAESAADDLAKAKRALQLSNVVWRKERAEKAVADAVCYMQFFGIRRKGPVVFPEIEWNDALLRAERIENPDPASKDKRERAKAQRKQAEYARRRLAEIDDEIANNTGLETMRLMAQRNAWRLDCAEWEGRGTGYYEFSKPVMLRLNGEEIETSMGARIPVSFAPMLWRAVERVRASGVPYEHNGYSIHAGDYRVDCIEPDGTLIAGCHRVEHSELRAMARQLGLA